VDVGVVFRVNVLQLGMDGRVAGAGQAGESLVNLDEGIAGVEVGVAAELWFRAVLSTYS
jgi:hypothetical protein